MSGMCPYCGKEVSVLGGLTVWHFMGPLDQTCPGSKQHYRNAESDARPLWNGERNERFCG